MELGTSVPHMELGTSVPHMELGTSVPHMGRLSDHVLSQVILFSP